MVNINVMVKDIVKKPPEIKVVAMVRVLVMVTVVVMAPVPAEL